MHALIIHSNRGMSLIEALVSVAILAVTMSGFASMFTWTQTEARRLRAQQQVLALGMELQNAMVHSRTCKSMIQVSKKPELDLTKAKTEAGQQIQLRLPSGETVGKPPSVRDPDSFPDVRVKSLALVDPVSAGKTVDGDSVYTVGLAMQLQQRGSQFQFQGRKIADFTVVTNDEGVIRDCYVFREGETQNAESYCEALGGVYKSKKCMLKDMPERCTIRNFESQDSDGSTHCCQEDEIAFSGAAPSDPGDSAFKWKGVRCMDVRAVGKGNPIQLMCCK